MKIHAASTPLGGQPREFEENFSLALKQPTTLIH